MHQERKQMKILHKTLEEESNERPMNPDLDWEDQGTSCGCQNTPDTILDMEGWARGQSKHAMMVLACKYVLFHVKTNAALAKGWTWQNGCVVSV